MQFNLAALSKDHTRSTAKKKKMGIREPIYLRTEILKNQTLFCGTYLYSLFIGVTPRGVNTARKRLIMPYSAAFRTVTVSPSPEGIAWLTNGEQTKLV